MARWIHEFRSAGERALTEQERALIAGRAKWLRLKQVVFAALSVLAFVAVPGFIIAATSCTYWLWPLSIPCMVLGFYACSWANDAEKFAILHRRGLRIGTVEEFRRVPGDETAKHFWERIGHKSSGEDEEEQNEHLILHPHLPPYWKVDEELEEALARSVRGKVETFETVGRDGAVLFVEGCPVRKLLEPPVWEVLG